MGDDRGDLAEREERLRRAEARLEQARAAHLEAIRARERETEQLREARAELAARRARVLEEIRRREDRIALREETLALGLATVEQAIRDGLSGEPLAEVVRVLRESLSVADDASDQPPAPERLWNVDMLAPLVRERARVDPERALEWEAYLDSLRPHADADGFVPGTFNSLLEGVFGDEFRAALVRVG